VDTSDGHRREQDGTPHATRLTDTQALTRTQPRRRRRRTAESRRCVHTQPVTAVHFLGSQAHPTLLVRGDHLVPLPPIGDECRGGCDVDILLVAPADASRRLPVPTSPLLDAASPMLSRVSLTLAVAAPPEALGISIELDAPVAPPASQVGCLMPRSVPFIDSTRTHPARTLRFLGRFHPSVDRCGGSAGKRPNRRVRGRKGSPRPPPSPEAQPDHSAHAFAERRLAPNHRYVRAAHLYGGH
jgi:hypothetical protein